MTEERLVASLGVSRKPSQGAAVAAAAAVRRALTMPMARRNTQTSLSSVVNRQVARSRLRHSVHMLRLMLRFIRIVIYQVKNESEDDQIKSADTLGTTFNPDAFGGLVFDPSYFKAKRDVDLTAEMKTILSTDPSERTEEQIQIVLIGLQFLDSFNELPTHVQEKLCRVAFYSSVPPKRLIIRQGHAALNFYFIVSGRALVNILSRDENTGESSLRTVAVLRKGESFGEIALLHNMTRTASVVSQEAMQLLSIGREDFLDIYMVGTNGQIPPHIAFLNTLEVFKGFPMQRLIEKPQFCIPTFYKRGRVIESNNKKTEYLYIIMSGTCKVMKELKVNPSDKPDDPLAVSEDIKKKKPLRTKSGTVFSLQNIGKCEPKVNSFRRSKTTITSRKGDEIDVTSGTRNQQMGSTKIVQVGRRMGTREIPKIQIPTSHTHGHTAQDENKKSVFVEIAVLKARDVFGLSAVIFRGERDLAVEESAPVCLISNGAECILMNKDFFIYNVNEELRQNIRRIMRPYPNEGTFTDNYYRQMAWNTYRQDVYNTALGKNPREKTKI